jgi:DNA-binding NarL/FixJ family response regulator
MQRIKVLLADDHRVVREGLRALLMTDREIEIVGEAADGVQAVALAKRFMPDVAVIDLAMPEMDGLRAAREITNTVRFARVIILSSYCTDDYVQRAVEAGAMGYLTKHDAASDLLTAIREVDNGNAFFSASAAKRLVDNCRETLIKLAQQNTSQPAVHLSPVEEETVELPVAAGSFVLPEQVVDRATPACAHSVAA